MKQFFLLASILSTVLFGLNVVAANDWTPYSEYSKEIYRTYGAPLIFEDPSTGETKPVPLEDIKKHVIPNGVENPFFWEVTNSNGRVVGHFLGTSHSPESQIHPSDLPDDILKKMYESDNVFMEAEPNYLSERMELLWMELYDRSPSFLGESRIDRLRSDYYSVPDLIEEIEYNKAAHVNTGIPFRDFSGEHVHSIFSNDSHHPFVVGAEFFRASTFVKSDENSPSLDEALYNLYEKRFASSNKEVKFLESLFDQINTAHHFQTAENIIELIDQPGNVFWNFRILAAQDMTAYLKGDLEYFESTNDDLESWQYEALIGKRNDSWLKKLKPLLESSKKPIFVFAGYLHFTGAKSLVKLMEQEGYRVQRQSYHVQD